MRPGHSLCSYTEYSLQSSVRHNEGDHDGARSIYACILPAAFISVHPLACPVHVKKVS